MLKEKRLWYLLEILPLLQTRIGKNGQEVESFRWNLGNPRTIEHLIPRFHKSVKDREKDWEGKKYDPFRYCRHFATHEMVHEDDDLPEY
ncbi:hypothetical protein FRC00_012537, partial [Tulasnella sp. 408]